MIKVGDKVVIVGDSNIGKQVEYGEIGVIAQVDHGMRYPYLVTAKDIDDGSDLTIWYPEASVKPAVQEVPWIENKTGKCPFKSNPKLLIDVKFRNSSRYGILEGVPANASFSGNDTTDPFWQLDGLNNDIVAYRVVADSEGWIKNSGVYPVEGDAALEIRFFGETQVYPSNHEGEWQWAIDDEGSCDIEVWRFKQPKAEVAPAVEAPTLAQQVARLEEELAEAKVEIADLTNTINSIRDLV